MRGSGRGEVGRGRTGRRGGNEGGVTVKKIKSMSPKVSTRKGILLCNRENQMLFAKTGMHVQKRYWLAGTNPTSPGMGLCR